MALYKSYPIINATLLSENSISIKTTSLQTHTLSNDINNYQMIIITTQPLGEITCERNYFCYVDFVDTFKTRGVAGVGPQMVIGSSMGTLTCTIKYVDTTTITTKFSWSGTSTTGTRTIYIYGIK